MALIELGPWAPDLPFVTPGVLRDVKNTVFQDNAYQPFLLPHPELPEPIAAPENLPTATIAARSPKDGTTSQWYVGRDGGLYRLNNFEQTYELVHASPSGAVIIHPRGSMVQFGPHVIYSNGRGHLLRFDITEVAIRVEEIMDSPENVRSLAIMGDNHLLASTENNIHWSDTNNIDVWSATQVIPEGQPNAGSGGPGNADTQPIAEGGRIQQVVGGTYGWVFTQTAVYRMIETGGDLVFTIQNLTRDIGLLGQGCAVRVQEVVYFLSERGLFSVGQQGGNLRPIGLRTVDNWLFERLDIVRARTEMHTIVDPENGLVTWLFPIMGTPVGALHGALIYNYEEDRFTYADLSDNPVSIADYALAPALITDSQEAATFIGITDTGDETKDVPTDSPFFGSNRIDLQGFSPEGHIVAFTRPPTALLETSARALADEIASTEGGVAAGFTAGGRAIVTDILPVVQNAPPAPTPEISARVAGWDVPPLNQAFPPESDIPFVPRFSGGRCPVMGAGRFLVAQIKLTGHWRNAEKIEATVEQDGLMMGGGEEMA